MLTFLNKPFVALIFAGVLLQVFALGNMSLVEKETNQKCSTTCILTFEKSVSTIINKEKIVFENWAKALTKR